MPDTQPNDPKARVNQRNSRRQKPKSTTRAVAVPNRFGIGGANIAVSVLDVSESGVRLKLTRDLPIGHEFEVKLENIASKGVKTTARVVCRPGQRGGSGTPGQLSGDWPGTGGKAAFVPLRGVRREPILPRPGRAGTKGWLKPSGSLASAGRAPPRPAGSARTPRSPAPACC